MIFNETTNCAFIYLAKRVSVTSKQELQTLENSLRNQN